MPTISRVQWRVPVTVVIQRGGCLGGSGILQESMLACRARGARARPHSAASSPVPAAQRCNHTCASHVWAIVMGCDRIPPMPLITACRPFDDRNVVSVTTSSHTCTCMTAKTAYTLGIKHVDPDLFFFMYT